MAFLLRVWGEIRGICGDTSQIWHIQYIDECIWQTCQGKSTKCSNYWSCRSTNLRITDNRLAYKSKGKSWICSPHISYFRLSLHGKGQPKPVISLKKVLRICRPKIQFKTANANRPWAISWLGNIFCHCLRKKWFIMNLYFYKAFKQSMLFYLVKVHFQCWKILSSRSRPTCFSRVV